MMLMISIITPIINEQEFIAPFIKHINTLQGDFELILIDGGSTDNTYKEINKNLPYSTKKITVLSTHQGRGHQMNTGAAKAQGTILLFLHIDCTIDPGTIPTIQKTINQQHTIGGGLTQTFSPTDQFLTLTSNFGNLRSKITQIFFGDCGIFIRKDIFTKIGGYDKIIYLEDVELCKKAKKHGKLTQIPPKISTSPRRYQQIGKIKITLIFTLTYLLNSIGLRPNHLKKFIIDKKH
jgi:rSAM/selenodomain-associated transferase 2